MKRKYVTLKLTLSQADELWKSIDGWLDAAGLSPNDRDEGMRDPERDALEFVMDEITRQTVKKPKANDSFWRRDDE